MDEMDRFVDRMKSYIDKRVEKYFAQKLDTEMIKNTNTYGYRTLGVNQLMQYNGNQDDPYTVGSGDPPVVGP